MGIFLDSQSSFVCIRLNGCKYSKWLNSSIWPIDGTLTGITTPSGPESNDNEGWLHTKIQKWNLVIGNLSAKHKFKLQN